MTHGYHADAPQSKRYGAAGRLLLLVVAFTVFNIWSRWSFWSIVGVANFGLAMVAFSVVVGTSWGERLEILPDTISIHKHGEKPLSIPVPEITLLTVKAGNIAVLWRQ